MRPNHWLGLVLLSCVLLLAACESDDDGGGGGGTTDAEQISDALLDLSDQTTISTDTPESRFLLTNNEAAADILTRFLPADAFLALQIGRQLDEPAELATLVQSAPQAFVAARALARLRATKGIAHPPFGTYQYLLDSLDPNFPNWELVAFNVPDNGYVFEFELDDGFTGFDESGNVIPVAGEIRVLEVFWNEFNEATEFTFEIAIGTESHPSLATIIRIPVTLESDGTGTVGSIHVGDPDANSTSITAFPDVCFVGDTLFSFVLEITDTSAYLLWRAYDSLAEFVFGFEVTALGDPSLGEFYNIDGSIGFGEAEDPNDPEWEFQIAVTRLDVSKLSNIAGAILHNNRELATFAGTDVEIPIDIDGDGEILLDETCIDVDITFVDDPENPMNICQFLYAHAQDFAPLNAKLEQR